VPLAQHRAKASPQPPIRTLESGPKAVAKIAVPASQYRVCRGYDGGQALPVISFCESAQFLAQLFLALLTRPFPASVKVPAKKVESLSLGVDDARFGWMHYLKADRFFLL
jgi:hypothetical protein